MTINISKIEMNSRFSENLSAAKAKRKCSSVLKV